MAAQGVPCAQADYCHPSRAFPGSRHCRLAQRIQWWAVWHQHRPVHGPGGPACSTQQVNTLHFSSKGYSERHILTPPGDIRTVHASCYIKHRVITSLTHTHSHVAFIKHFTMTQRDHVPDWHQYREAHQVPQMVCLPACDPNDYTWHVLQSTAHRMG
jgi:hypothetical protein